MVALTAPHLLAGPLAQADGVRRVDALVPAAVVSQMRREALAGGRDAVRQTGATQPVDAGRSDVAGRALASAPGGRAQDRLYHSASLLRGLSDLCGVDVVPTGGRGSYSYYTRPGDHLDVHVDVDRCDVTLITVLQDSTPPDDAGGSLVAWPSYLGRSLDAIRSSEAPPEVTVDAPQGASVLILGGLLPHAVHPLGCSGTRVISALCFAAA